MQPRRAGQHPMFLLLTLYVFVSCIIYPSVAHISSPWRTFGDLTELVELQMGADVYIRADSANNTSDNVVSNKPAGDDGALTWDQAVGKGGNLVKLLDTEDLSQCGMPQSNFTKWEALAQNGWIKLNQGGASEPSPQSGANWTLAAANLGLSTDSQKNIPYLLGQLHNATIDGTNYRFSLGRYGNVMNTDGGVCALQSLSPRSQGALRAPPVDGSPGNEIVPLQTWADVTFLEWADACKGDEKCVKGLKVITKCHSQSNATMRIADQALGGTDGWGIWPGKSFSKDSEQFAALMATPSGRGVAWLLLTHREQLGWKSVKSVNLWSEKDHDSELNYYTFQLEDRADSGNSPSRRARSAVSDRLFPGSVVEHHSRRDTQGNQSRIVYDGDSPSVNYAEIFASDHDYSHEQAQNIGAILVNLTQTSAEQACVQQIQWQFSDLASNGWNASTTGSNDTAALDSLRTVFADAKLSMDDEAPERAIWEHSAAATINGTAYPATHAKYDALLSKHAIVLLGASSPVSQNDGKGLLPPLKALSDILWLQWAESSNAKKTDVKDLRFLEVYRATNPYTNRMIGQIFGGQTPPSYPGKSFAADSKELHALLASPHGQGVVWLLSQHKSELGTKIVQSVQIWNDQQPCLLFQITSFQTNGTQDDGPASEARAVRKSLSARADSWEEAVAKGKRYLAMLKCGTGTPSTFTSYDSLAAWGWETTLKPRPLLLEPEIRAVENLGASYSPDETWDILDNHKLQVENDGTVYPPTGGNYRSYYAPEFIIPFYNFGPRKSTMGPPPGNIYPQLERQSDVMFLEYQHRMEAMNKPMTGLKGVLRSGVINEETQSTVAKALGMKTYVARQVPQWPGQDFEADSDEAAALVVTPNGRAAVWLLGTHKEQLGHKTISRVRVYRVGITLSILFIFEDVTEDSSNDDNGPSSSLRAKKRSVNASEGYHLQKRAVRRSPQAPSGPATDSAWAQAVQRGKEFMDMLNCNSGPQSTWTNHDDLAKWGWVESLNERAQTDGKEVNAMNYLGLSTLPELTAITIEHIEASDNDGRHYNPTNADYGNYYASELIVAVSNWGPSGSLSDGPPPRLRQLSDIWFLAYSDLMKAQNKPLDGLKGIMRHHIANPETRSMIYKATKVDPARAADVPLKWPGVDYQADSDEFAALLASPNGRGVAWLLLNHNQLGRKTIDSVRVWFDGSWMLLFVFKDITDDADDEIQSSDPNTLQSNNAQQSTSLAIAARALRPERYQELVAKGKVLVSALQSTEDCFPKSEFTDYAALADWGWTVRVDEVGAPMKTVPAANVFGLLGASWKPEVNRKVTDKHDKMKVKDGKTYNPTGASYGNHYNPVVIIAKSNFGPAYYGRQQPVKVTGGPDDPFPLLARQSDFMYLEFRRVMTENRQPMDGLKGVWREHIMNEDTKGVAIQIASTSYMPHDIPGWPGTDFAAGSDEFAALVASPNGVGVAYFLLQHREILGQKTITSAKVWYDMAIHVLFLIDDLGAQAGPSTQRNRQNPVNSSSVGQQLTSVANLLRPRALDDSTYATFTEKGKALVSALQATDTCVTQSEWTTVDSLATWGWNQSRQTNVSPVSLSNSTSQVYEFVGASMDDNMNHRAIDTHDGKEEIGGITYYKTGAQFTNLYNPSMIVAENIHGAELQGKTGNPPVTGDPNPFPKLKLWSDVTFLEYQRFMNESNQAIDALKAVWHRAIINPSTLDLAARLFGVSDWTAVAAWPGKDFKPGTDEFAALVGSDNGKGVVYLLLQHKQQLGARSITNARVWKDNTLHVLYSIDDTCGGGGDAPTTSSLVLRADVEDSQDVNDARSAGRFLVMAQDSTTDILESCLNIPQSTFTETSQLVASGWKKIADRPENLEEDMDAATFDSWLDMNLDLSSNSNRKIEYQHVDQTTGSDGTIYYPSGAYYRNLYSEGGIAALDNASPWKTGRNREPPVDGRARPFPPLKQWSDAVFLVYKDVCNSDPVRMKNLKGCLRHNVVNVRAKRVLYEYMEKNGDLQDDRPKPWPGTEYNLDVDDGFNVALGVPNGKGVAYLLVTHREALGWKEIYKIRIFSAEWASSYNILYYIRDHRDSATRRDLSHPLLTTGAHPASTLDLALQLRDEDQSVDRKNILGAAAPPKSAAERHWTRADATPTYMESLRRGARLYCMTANDISTVEQSAWVDYASLAEYGWTRDSRPQIRIDDELVDAYRELGLSPEPSANLLVRFDHDTDTEHNGVEFPLTNGEYENIFNVDGGAIVAESNFGPDTRGARIPPANMVPLKQYSDVVFLAWQQEAGDKVKGLKYIFRHGIVNDETKAVVREVLVRRGVRRSPVLWPGLKISMQERDAWAILGTPNGRGAAWMLLQHKAQLGLKTFSDVTIFQDEQNYFSLLFWVRDLEEALEIEVPPDLQAPPRAARDTGNIGNRSSVVPNNVTTTAPTLCIGEWVMRAISKRTGGAVEKLWAALKLF